MKLQQELISFGLDFYGVNEQEYREGIQNCADLLFADREKREKFEEIITILHEKEEKISCQLPSIKEIFGFDLPYLSHLALLIGARHHEKIMMERGYDADQWKVQMEKIHHFLTSVHPGEALPNLSPTGLVWTSYFPNGRLIQVGRLQYENCPDGIHVHIPAGKDLNSDEVRASLKGSYSKVQKYFGIENPEYRCSSWLLSPEIASFLKEDSNIKKFQSFFDLQEGIVTTNGVYRFLFKVPLDTPFDQLPENTSLQRAVKAHLLAGKEIHNGIGFVKRDVFFEKD